MRRGLSLASISKPGWHTGPSSRKRSSPPAPREQALQPVAGTPAGARRSQIPWAILQVPPHDVRRDEPPIEQRGEPRPKASLA